MNQKSESVLSCTKTEEKKEEGNEKAGEGREASNSSPNLTLIYNYIRVLWYYTTTYINKMPLWHIMKKNQLHFNKRNSLERKEVTSVPFASSSTSQQRPHSHIILLCHGSLDFKGEVSRTRNLPCLNATFQSCDKTDRRLEGINCEIRGRPLSLHNFILF